MKLITFLLLHSLLTSTVMAQLQQPPVTVKKNTAVTSHSLPGTTLKMPNLTLTIRGIRYNDAEKKYDIHYILTNDGTDMSDSYIRLQGSVVSAGGSFMYDGGTDVVHVKSLKQGEQYKGMLTHFIPLYIWQKNCIYKLEADPDNIIRESNEKDNMASSSISGYLDLPDLTIVSARFIYQDSILQNGSWKHRFKVQYELKNNSTVPASLDVYVTGLFGPTPRPGCGAIVSGVQPTSNIKIGPWGTITNQIGCTADRNTLSNGATYTLTINTNPKTIEEKDMANNSITINIPPIPANN